MNKKRENRVEIVIDEENSVVENSDTKGEEVDEERAREQGGKCHR